MAECIKKVMGANLCPEGEMMSYYNGYLSGIPKYVDEENKWLDIQGAYMDRWDFKLFEPWYIKQAGEYQWKMYEGYRDDAKTMMEIIEQGGKSDEANDLQTEARNRRVEYEQRYSDFFDQAVEIKDWRKKFADVPIPASCNEENLTIPDTIGILD